MTTIFGNSSFADPHKPGSTDIVKTSYHNQSTTAGASKVIYRYVDQEAPNSELYLRTNGSGYAELYDQFKLQEFMTNQEDRNLDEIGGQTIAEVFGFIAPNLQAWKTIISTHRLAETPEYENSAKYRAPGKKVDSIIHMMPTNPTPLDRMYLELTILLALFLNTTPAGAIAGLFRSRPESINSKDRRSHMYPQSVRKDITFDITTPNLRSVDVDYADFADIYTWIQESSLVESSIRAVFSTRKFSHSDIYNFGPGRFKFDATSITIYSDIHIVMIEATPGETTNFKVTHRHRLSKRVNSEGISALKHTTINPNEHTQTVKSDKPKRGLSSIKPNLEY